MKLLTVAYTDLCMDLILIFSMVEYACGIFFGYKFMDVSCYLYISKAIPINKNAIFAFLKKCLRN